MIVDHFDSFDNISIINSPNSWYTIFHKDTIEE